MPKINRVILLLMVSDIFLFTGFGLIDPILAIYVNDNIIGGTIFTAGLASTVFLVTKSIVQLPFSRRVDKYNDLHDVKWLIIGTALIVLTPVIYLFSTHIFHMFLAQFIHGIGSGLAYSTWLGIWSTHLDKKQESFEWSMYLTAINIGTAISAAAGGAIAQFVGFRWTFVFITILCIIGCLILFQLRGEFLKRAAGTSRTKQKVKIQDDPDPAVQK